MKSLLVSAACIVAISAPAFANTACDGDGDLTIVSATDDGLSEEPTGRRTSLTATSVRIPVGRTLVKANRNT